VWGSYDSKNELVTDIWQRCFSFQDVKHRLSTPEKLRIIKLERIKKKYLESTKDLEYYEESFNQKLKEILND
jgi:hypothetical protein